MRVARIKERASSPIVRYTIPVHPLPTESPTDLSISVCGILALGGNASAGTCYITGCSDNSGSSNGPVVSGDPSICYYWNGSGFTPDDEVLVGLWDPSTNVWTATDYVYADSNGDIANGNFNLTCQDNDDQWFLGYDVHTGTTCGYWYVNEDCTE